MNDLHRAIKRLLSITLNGYEMFYAPLYLNLNYWIEKNVPDLSPDIKTKRLETIWRYGEEALKIRRGYLLPFGSDAETCYREQEIWSYAVFTATLCYRTASHFHPSHPNWDQTVLPPAGLQWLAAYPVIFDSWKAYLQHADNTTAFYTIEKRLIRSEQYLEAKLKSGNDKKT